MKKETIFTMPSPYRDDFRIQAYTFGEGAPTLAIVGAMRGDEIQQQYIASQTIRTLRKAEADHLITPGVSITVIPSVNPFSMNIEKRFWALDNTDINRMFPGYDRGETTQRIAAATFEYIKTFRYGIQLASYYLPGNFVPHVRMIRTGFEDIHNARLFGLPYVCIRKPTPFDTVLLNYNWQIWETSAFSIYAGQTDAIDTASSLQVIEAMCRFMQCKNLVALSVPRPERRTTLVDEDEMVTLQAPHAGILIAHKNAAQKVRAGETIAQILHPYEGSIIAEVKAPCNGTIFFSRSKSLTYQNTILFRIRPTRRTGSHADNLHAQ